MDGARPGRDYPPDGYPTLALVGPSTWPPPVVLGYGVRLLGDAEHEPIRLSAPRVVAGEGALHLAYTVER